MTTSIKRVDPYYLISGDRYNGKRGVPKEVLSPMSEFVDVLSIQYFPERHYPDAHEKMKDDIKQWFDYAGKPVLLADIGNW